MTKNYFDLKARLEFQRDWANYFSSYFNHLRISQRVASELRKEQPLLSIIINFYYLPLNILKYMNRLKMIYSYNRCVKEIDILQKELDLARSYIDEK